MWSQSPKVMPRPSYIQAVTFDAGGTLLKACPSVGEIYAQFASRHGIEGASAAECQKRFLQAWAARPNFNYTRPEWAELVDEVFTGLAKIPPSKTFFDELYAHFARPQA